MAKDLFRPGDPADLNPPIVLPSIPDRGAAGIGLRRTGARADRPSMDDLIASLPEVPAPESAAPASKGWGQTLMEGVTKGVETAGLGLTAQTSRDPAAVARQLQDTQIPRSPEEQAFDQQTAGAAKAFDDADGLAEKFKAGLGILGVMARNPKQAAGTVAQSIGMSAPGLAAAGAGAAIGAAVGPVGSAVGAFTGYVLGNFATNIQAETAQKVEQLLQERGVNTDDPAAVQRAIASDPAFFDIVREYGVKKGVATGAVEGAVDLATAGLAGKAAGIIRRGETALARTGRGAAAGTGAALAQGASEGLGSAAGQAAVGEDVSWGQAVTEGAYGVAAGPVDIALAYKAGAGRPDPAPADGAPQPPVPPAGGPLAPVAPGQTDVRFVGRDPARPDVMYTGPTDGLGTDSGGPALVRPSDWEVVDDGQGPGGGGPPRLPGGPAPRLTGPEGTPPALERPESVGPGFVADEQGNVRPTTPDSRMADQSRAGDMRRPEAWLEGAVGRMGAQDAAERARLGLTPDVERAQATRTEPWREQTQPGDTLFDGRRPFMFRSSAEAMARKTGGEVIPVPGGFVVRPAAVDDFQRRLNTPEIADELRAMAKEAGWAEIGGRMIRRAGEDGTAQTESVSRTTWQPKADWWAGMQNRLPRDTSGRKTEAAVERAFAGEKLSAAERRVVDEMLRIAERELEIRSGARDEFGMRPGDYADIPDAPAATAADDPYAAAERDAIIAEAEMALEDLDDAAFDQLLAAALTEGDLTDAEIEAALPDAPAGVAPDAAAAGPQPAGAGGAQGAQRAGPDEGGDGRGEPARPDRAGAEDFALTGQTPEEVRQKQAAQERERAEQAKRDAAPPPDDFVLTGSDSPADQARARGQMELGEAPAADPKGPQDRNGLRESDRYQGRVDADAVELAGQIKDESDEPDFSPAEAVTAIKQWAKDSTVAADDLRDAVYKRLPQKLVDRLKKAWMKEARKPARPAPKAEAPKQQSVTGKPLYAARRLTSESAAKIIEWAQRNGFKSTLKPEDLHVTIAYSRDPVDGAAVAPDASGEQLRVEGGQRTVEPLGDKGAVVLKVTSPALQARWKQYRDAGASWDWPEYQPHITITYDGAGVDLSKVKRFVGPIVLGPEYTQDLDVDAADKVEEVKAPTLTERANKAVAPKGADGLTDEERAVKNKAAAREWEQRAMRQIAEEDAAKGKKAVTPPAGNAASTQGERDGQEGQGQGGRGETLLTKGEGALKKKAAPRQPKADKPAKPADDGWPFATRPKPVDPPKRSQRDGIRRNLRGNLFGSRRVTNPSRAQDDALYDLRTALDQQARATGIDPTGLDALGAATVPFRVRPVAALLQSIFGVELQFIDGAGRLHPELTFNGIYVGGRRVFISAQSNLPFHQVIGHEFLHWLRRSNPDLYTDLTRRLAPLLKARAATQEARYLSGAYGRMGLTEDVALDTGWEEVYADVFGDAWADPAFWKDFLSTLKPTFAQTIVGKWRLFWTRIRLALAGIGVTLENADPVVGQLLKDAEAVRRTIAEVMAEQAGADRAAPEDAEVSRSARKPRLSTLLRQYGQQPESPEEAARWLSEGWRVFVAHEMDEQPVEVKSVERLLDYSYAEDQMIGLPPESLRRSQRGEAANDEVVIDMAAARAKRELAEEEAERQGMLAEAEQRANRERLRYLAEEAYPWLKSWAHKVATARAIDEAAFSFPHEVGGVDPQWLADKFDEMARMAYEALNGDPAYYGGALKGDNAFRALSNLQYAMREYGPQIESGIDAYLAGVRAKVAKADMRSSRDRAYAKAVKPILDGNVKPFVPRRSARTPPAKQAQAERDRMGRLGQLGPMRASVKAWFDHYTKVLGSLPDREFYLEQRYLAQGRIGEADKIAAGIRKAFADASPKDKGQLYAYLTDAGASPDVIDDAGLRKMAVDTKHNIQLVGRLLVRHGFMSPETLAKRDGAYLPRLYLAHLLDDSDWRAIGAGKKPSDMGYLKQRQDIPEDVRRVILGEIKDPAYLSSMAIVRPMRDIALLGFLEKIAGREGLVLPKSVVEFDGKKVTPMWLKAEADRLRNQARYMEDRGDAKKAVALAERMDAVADPLMDELRAGDYRDWRKLPDSPRYGRLRGLHVRKEVYEDIVGVYDLMPEDLKWYEPQSIVGYGGVGTRVTQWWKVGKVTMNPGSQVRNVISNAVMLQLSGVSMHMVVPRIVQAIKEIQDGGPHWKIAQRYGVTEASFVSRELPEIKRDAIKLQLETIGEHPLKRIGLLATLIGARVVETAGDFHQAMEYIGKTAKIIDAMAKGATEAEAALEAQDWLFDYSLVPRSVRYLRNQPIAGSPFLTWMYKAAPRLLEVAALHPQRLLPWIGMVLSMPILASMALGGDADDWDEMKRLLPEWARKKSHLQALPFRDSAGRIQFIDLGPYLPWTMWTDFLYNAPSEPVKATQDLISQIFGWGPVGSLGVAMSTGVDPFTDRKIVPDGEPPARQAAAWASYIWSLAMPPLITAQGFAGKMTQGVSGDTNRYGDPRTTPGQAAATLGGANVYGINPDTNAAQEISRLNKEMTDVKIRMLQRLQDRGLSDEKRQSIMAEYIAEINARAQRLQDYAERASKVPKELKVQPEPAAP